MPKDDLVARLRGWADEDREGPFSRHKRIQFEAAAAIEALRAEVEGLRADAERLDSRMILVRRRDEFGDTEDCLHTQIDLREAIDAARRK